MEIVLIIGVILTSSVMSIQTWLTDQQPWDWIFVVGRSKEVATGGKLLVNLCKQMVLFIFLIAGFTIPFVYHHLIIDCLTKTA